ncbi:MAG TPA: hypothetical protein VNF49_11905 [Candidatus Binataceae bacterium]|nr:hypothetical protein [Candidatus Binataceae bacterium]
MAWLLAPLILLSILFRREMRIIVLVLLLLAGAATWWAVDFWVASYDHWVACGRPTTTLCPD